MPRIGFFVKAGRHFAKRMETHKFVNTNLLIYRSISLSIGKSVCFKNCGIYCGLRGLIYKVNLLPKIWELQILYDWKNWQRYAKIVQGPFTWRWSGNLSRFTYIIHITLFQILILFFYNFTFSIWDLLRTAPLRGSVVNVLSLFWCY